MRDKRNKVLGLKYALAAACVSGVSIFYNKIVIVKGIDPLIFNILKNGGVALILTLLLLMSGKRNSIPGLLANKKLWLIGIIGGSIPFVLFFEGLTQIPAINANLIQKSLFIFVALLAIPLLREKINAIQIIGYLLVIYANFFIGGLTGFQFSIYEGMVLLATIFWALENIIAKKTLKKLGSDASVWGRMFFGTMVLLLIAFATGKSGLLLKSDPAQLLPIIGSITLLSLYVTFWYKALKLAPATQVSAILILATPITNILTSVFINRNLNSILNINTYILIIGVALIGLNMRKLKNNVKLLPKKAS